MIPSNPALAVQPQRVANRLQDRPVAVRAQNKIPIQDGQLFRVLPFAPLLLRPIELAALHEAQIQDNAVKAGFCGRLKRMAGTTRLELATSAVTAQRFDVID